MLTPAERNLIKFLAAAAVANYRREREKQQKPAEVRPVTQSRPLERPAVPGQ